MTEAEITMTVHVKVRCPEGMDISEAKTAAVDVIGERLQNLITKTTEGRKSQPIYVDYQCCISPNIARKS